MKWVFLGIAVAVVAMYAAAELSIDRPRDGVVRFRWATDAAASRPLQTATFAKLYPGYEAVVDPGLGGDQTKLLVQCATGVGPDVVDLYSVQQMHGQVEAGTLLDLTPYAAEMGFDVSQTYPALRDAMMVNGRQYRYPCNVTANAVIYNRELFDRYGVPYPTDDWTWDDFAALGGRFRAGGAPADFPVLSHYQSPWLFWDMLVGHGGRQFSDDGLVCILDSPVPLQVARRMIGLTYEHGVILDPAEAAAMSGQGGWNAGPIRWFGAGRSAMIITGRWYLIMLAKDFPGMLPKIGAVRLPRAPGRESRGFINARAAAINVNSRHRDAGLKFLQYLASREYSELIVQDGDALPPNPRYAQTGGQLVNAAMRDPAFHQTFIDAAGAGGVVDVSPFIDALMFNRLLEEALDKMERQMVSPEDGMRALAKETNMIIRRNLERRPDLQRRFEQITGRPYTPDWWRAHPAVVGQ